MSGRKPKNELDRLVERIRTSGELSDADRDALLDFHREIELLGKKYSIHRHLKLLRHCTIMAEQVGELADALETKTATEDIVRWINREYENEETNRDYRVALRVFGRRATDEAGDEPPDSIDWVPSGTSRNYDPAPDPAQMLDWEDDVLPMIEVTSSARDAALIAVAWDSGARSGEIRSLTIGDIADNRHGLQITVQGKVGQRSIILIPSVPYLKRWLDIHPASKNPNAPLWSKLNQPESFSYQMFRNILEGAADKAGVHKPVTFTNFRKSSASYLASQNVDQAHLEDHHGWKRGSDIASRYISTFSHETNREIARAHGADVEPVETEPIAPITCPRCDRETPRDEDFCVWCHQATSHDALEDLKFKERNLRDSVLKLVQDKPELLEEVDRLQTLMTVMEDNPALHEDAEAFLEALQAG